MSILVVGQSGQLAQSLAEQARAANFSELSFVPRSQLDLEHTQSIYPFIEKTRPKFIVNAAAWTAVDAAEGEAERAHLVNAIAPGILAQAATAVGARLIHISTDYVFNGNKSTPYVESDITEPQGVYGRTKAEGELRVRNSCTEHVILRTAWVYSPFGQNFVKTMLKLAQTRDELTVVDDQFGNPTSALDLSNAILAILSDWQNGGSKGLGETFHCAGTGSTNWASFAAHVLKTSRIAGGCFAKIKGIPTSSWPTTAKRPVNSQLNSAHFSSTFGYTFPHWQESSSDITLRIINAESA